MPLSSLWRAYVPALFLAPQTAKELSRRLAAIDSINAWTEDDARLWWATTQPPFVVELEQEF